MYPKNGKIVGVLLVVVLVCGGPVFQTVADEAAAVAKDTNVRFDETKWLDKAAGCYAKKGGFTAVFEHETISRIEQTGTSSPGKMSGKIWVSSKGLFKMEYKIPSEKRVVFDGRKIRAFDKETNTVVERLPKGDALFSSLLMVVRGSGSDILERFEVRALPSGKHPSLKLLVLIPRFSTELASKIVITLGDCPVLRRIIVVDRAGNMIRLTFSDIELNNRFSPGVFKLKVKGDVTIVRP